MNECQYPKISVITPSYNQGVFIERTIQSIINQKYPNLEYIIVDGGSKDGTLSVIKRYENKISKWISEPDRGQTDAINKGLKLATGEIVCWINSDDILLPDSLHHVGMFFMNHPHISYYNGVSIEIDDNDNILKTKNLLFTPFFFKRGCFNCAQQGMFWKRDIIDKIGYLNVDFQACMDVEYQARICEAGYDMFFENHPLGAIRIYATTKTASGGVIWKNDELRMKRLYGGRYISNKCSLYFILFACIKLLKGIYAKNILFYLFNHGKKVYDVFE